VELRAAGVTDAGRVRSVNQDRYLILANRMFVVADGMGGHRGGEVAAQMTVESLGVNADLVQSTSDLVKRLEQTNQAVLDRSNDDPELRGMGTTVTAVALFKPEAKNPVVSIINVGDSRTYRMRAGELEQLTEDHSVVAELMRTGRLSPEEARGHRQRSVLTRAVGVEPTLETDTLEVLVNAADRFLLCSDGLYTEVTDLKIAAVLRQLGDPAEAAKELVRLALQNGGRDNVTVLIIDVLDERDPSYVASQSLANETTFGGSSVEPFDSTTNTTKKPDPKQSKSGTPGGVELAKLDEPRIKGAARKPWAINLRVLIFIGLLGALGAVVAWVITAGKDIPSDRRIPTTVSTSTIPATVTGSTILGGPAIPTSLLPIDGATGTTPGASTIANAPDQGDTVGSPTDDSSVTGTTPLNPTPTGPGLLGTGVAPSLVPTTLDPFDPAPRVKTKAKAKTTARTKTKTTAKSAKARKKAVVKKVSSTALGTTLRIKREAASGTQNQRTQSQRAQAARGTNAGSEVPELRFAASPINGFSSDRQTAKASL
jgi:PPM family protein phosphatase